MKKQIKLFLILALVFSQCIACSQNKKSEDLEKNSDKEATINAMLSLMNGSKETDKEILNHLSDTWEDGYIPMLLDVVYFTRRRVNHRPIINLIEEKTGEKFGDDIYSWFEWMWNKEPQILSNQGDWMAEIYKNIDPRFEKYFKNRTESSLIRLDEVRWGGVHQDGIPPLRGPKMLNADEANYLADDNIVFGISINGDHRAYPKRILAWHEMFVDEIGGESIAGVYCTLCGTVIAYNTKFNGKNYNLGTSGFLYRSNKLMYDKATQSLWNTIEGKPVIGPLSNSNIELASHSVVTTTWGEWKKLHPSTKVLSLKTGHQRNYSEGFAYQEYFSTDNLMFNVPELDHRLLNKDEVLIVRADEYKNDPLAISADFLSLNPVYHDQIGKTKFVVITDKSGGNRVYESNDYHFKEIKDETVKDDKGVTWQIEEEKLITSDGRVLKRLPYHRIFWFAWYNTFKNTHLVK